MCAVGDEFRLVLGSLFFFLLLAFDNPRVTILFLCVAILIDCVCICIALHWLREIGENIRAAMASGRVGNRIAKLIICHGSSISSLRAWPTTAAFTAQPWTRLGSRMAAVQELAPFGARAASSQIVRTRMKSVKSIQKITKAMKMVAASKLRGIQAKAENSRGMWQPFVALLGDNPGISVKKKVIVTVSSDKGLCGGINSTSVKYSKALLRMNALMGADKETKYVIIGEKGKAQLQRDSRKAIGFFVGETQKIGICFTQVCLSLLF